MGVSHPYFILDDPHLACEALAEPGPADVDAREPRREEVRLLGGEERTGLVSKFEIRIDSLGIRQHA